MPTIREAYAEIYGREPDGEIWSAYRSVLAAAVSMAKVLWLHGDAPPKAIDELRAAARAMLSDSAFVGQAKREIGDYDFLIGPPLRAKPAHDCPAPCRAWPAGRLGTPAGGVGGFGGPTGTLPPRFF